MHRKRKIPSKVHLLPTTFVFLLFQKYTAWLIKWLQILWLPSRMKYISSPLEFSLSLWFVLTDRIQWKMAMCKCQIASISHIFHRFQMSICGKSRLYGKDIWRRINVLSWNSRWDPSWQPSWSVNYLCSLTIQWIQASEPPPPHLMP